MFVYAHDCLSLGCSPKGVEIDNFETCSETSKWPIPLIKKNRLVLTGLFLAILGKGPWPKLGKNDQLNSKLGEINIEHNKGIKIYPQNQVILDCVMPTIRLKHKCLSIILIWVIVSHK